MTRPARRQPTATASDMHRQWLQLVDIDGPFLAISPLKRVWPQGMPSLAEGSRPKVGVKAPAGSRLRRQHTG